MHRELNWDEERSFSDSNAEELLDDSQVRIYQSLDDGGKNRFLREYNEKLVPKTMFPLRRLESMPFERVPGYKSPVVVYRLNLGTPEPAIVTLPRHSLDNASDIATPECAGADPENFSTPCNIRKRKFDMRQSIRLRMSPIVTSPAVNTTTTSLESGQQQTNNYITSSGAQSQQQERSLLKAKVSEKKTKKKKKKMNGSSNKSKENIDTSEMKSSNSQMPKRAPKRKRTVEEASATGASEGNESRSRDSARLQLHNKSIDYVSSLVLPEAEKNQSRSRKRVHSLDARKDQHSPPAKTNGGKSKGKKAEQSSSVCELSDDDRRYERFLDRLCDLKYQLPMCPQDENVFYIKFIDLDNGSYVEMFDMDDLKFEEYDGVHVGFYPDTVCINMGLMRLLPGETKPLGTSAGGVSYLIRRGQPRFYTAENEVFSQMCSCIFKAGEPYKIVNDTEEVALLEFLLHSY